MDLYCGCTETRIDVDRVDRTYCCGSFCGVEADNEALTEAYLAAEKASEDAGHTGPAYDAYDRVRAAYIDRFLVPEPRR